MPIFSVVVTYFQLRFWYVLKQRKPGILWVWCPFSHESGWVQLICHVLLTHYKTYIGGRSYSLTTKQTICWNSVGFLDLHKQTWVASTDMNLLLFIVPWWNIKRCLQFRRNSNLLLFFYFSVMIQSGEFLASLWQEEGNFEVLKRCYIQIYPTIVFLLC